jgi:hypothetical protein
MRRFSILAQRVAVPLVLSLCLLVSRLARADEATPADPGVGAPAVAKLTNEGMTLFRAADYRHALERFLQAATIDQDSNLLFNIARCYEMLGDRDAAIEKYEAFLAKPDADSQGKVRANEAIRMLRDAKARSAAAAAAPPVVAPQAAPPFAIGRNLDAGSGGVNPGDDGGRPLLTAAVVTLSAGVLVTAAGVIAMALGSADHDKVTNSAGYGNPMQVDPLTQTQAQALVDSGNSKQLAGEIAIGVGGALLVTSAVLFVVRSGHGGPDKETRSVAFQFAPSTSGARVLLEGRF